MYIHTCVYSASLLSQKLQGYIASYREQESKGSTTHKKGLMQDKLLLQLSCGKDQPATKLSGEETRIPSAFTNSHSLSALIVQDEMNGINALHSALEHWNILNL